MQDLGYNVWSWGVLEKLDAKVRKTSHQPILAYWFEQSSDWWYHLLGKSGEGEGLRDSRSCNFSWDMLHFSSCCITMR